MTVAAHGSAFLAVGQGLAQALEARPGMGAWNVRYSEPQEAKDLANAAGDQQAVWVSAEGGSAYQIATMPTGYAESGTVDVVFQAAHPEGPVDQAVVDEPVALAVGELLELLVENPTLAGHMADHGWGVTSASLAGLERDGGLLPGKPGRWRRVEVTVEWTARRCS